MEKKKRGCYGWLTSWLDSASWTIIYFEKYSAVAALRWGLHVTILNTWMMYWTLNNIVHKTSHSLALVAKSQISLEWRFFHLINKPAIVTNLLYDLICYGFSAALYISWVSPTLREKKRKTAKKKTSRQVCRHLWGQAWGIVLSPGERRTLHVLVFITPALRSCWVRAV